MNENEAMVEKKALFTVKNVLRVLAALCIFFGFCPAFLVSCSGQNVKISAIKAAVGISFHGERIAKPYPVLFVCVLLPIAVLVVLFVKKLLDKQSAAIIVGCTAVDVFVWFIFRHYVKKAADDSFCSFKQTVWFFLDLLCLLLLFVTSLLVLLGKMTMDCDLQELILKSSTANGATPVSSADGAVANADSYEHQDNVDEETTSDGNDA